MTLVEFLLARYDDIERPAEQAHRYEHDALRFASALHVLESIDPGMGRHFASQSPAYVLADIAAKRFVVDTLRSFEPSDEWDTEPDIGKRRNNAAGALRRMALPFAAHPDYDEAWRPS